MPGPGTTNRPPVVSVAILSASALAYEMLLMRLFSIVQWHHFAYMIISLALLGYGASGTFLSLAQARLLPRFPLAFRASIGLFGVSTIGCYLLAQRIPFNAETVLWDWRQPLHLVSIYLLLAVPFFFAANAVALAFMRFRDRVSGVYAADLLGAGAGSIGIIAVLLAGFPLTALGVVGAVGILNVAIAHYELRVPGRLPVFVVSLALATAAATLTPLAHLRMSPYKPLSQQLRIAGSDVVAVRSSPLGLLTVVRNETIPLRHAPGLGLQAENPPPAQLAVFTDGAGMTAITTGDAGPGRMAYLDQLTWSLPYHLFTPDTVLVLGAGGGDNVRQARLRGVREIHAVELNPQVVQLVRGTYAKFSGNLYDLPGISVHVADARGFLATGNRRFDLIQLSLMEGFAASSTGLHALNESYLYTVEALRTYIEHLSPGGFLAISRWINLPPRDALKLFATAVRALQDIGIPDPRDRLVLIRGWQTSTLLVKHGVVTPAEVAKLRRFAEQRAFDVCWFPGIEPGETNRFNLLADADYYHGARALLGTNARSFLDRYKFNIVPAIDDRPYFHQFFRWRALPEILGLRARGGMPLLEWGYLVLIGTLLQALLAAALLILLPLSALRRTTRAAPGIRLPRVLVFFAAIGLAFLFVEIAFIQRFIVFLHHPLYAVAVVLTGFLVFAGLGSRYARHLAHAGHHTRGVWLAVLGIACLGLLYLSLLGPLFAQLMHWPLLARGAVSLALILPLAFAMGLPFPLALERLGREAPALIPWAWGVNGCASVVSAVLATLLAIHLGFQAVILSALVLYLVAAASLPAGTAPASRLDRH